MNIDRDKYLTEAMGLCWHEENKQRKDVLRCVCSNQNHYNYTLERHIEKSNPNFSTWSAFGTLWEFAIKQEWWMEFWVKEGQFYKNSVAKAPVVIWNELINPDKFADALYKFLKERKTK